LAVASVGSASSNVGTSFPPLVNGNAVVPAGVTISVSNATTVTGDLLVNGVLALDNAISLTVGGTCYISGTVNAFPVSFLRCQGLLVLRNGSMLIAQTNATGRVVPVSFRSLQGFLCSSLNYPV